MEAKKTPKADLQNKRGLFLEIGLCITLLLMIVVFRVNQGEVTTAKPTDDREVITEELPEITFEEQKPPEVQRQVVQQLVDVLKIVSDDRKIETSLTFAEFDDAEFIDFQPVVTAEEETVSDEPYVRVENMPKFQGGGTEAFVAWVQRNVKYPAMASENGISGTVRVEFVIERDGSLTNILILQTPDRSLSEATETVLRSSPKWTPGSQRGVPVRVKCNIPVRFVLGNLDN